MNEYLCQQIVSLSEVNNSFKEEFKTEILTWKEKKYKLINLEDDIEFTQGFGNFALKQIENVKQFVDSDIVNVNDQQLEEQKRKYT